MNLALPVEFLQENERRAFESLQHQMAEQWQRSHASNGRHLTRRFVAFRNTTQTLTTATWTDVEFNAEQDVRTIGGVVRVFGVHSTTTTPSRLKVPLGHEGWLRVRVAGMFAANATGSRGLRILKNAVIQRGGQVFVTAATAIGPTFIRAEWSGGVSVGDDITVQAYQNSGGDLALGSATESDQVAVELEFL